MTPNINKQSEEVVIIIAKTVEQSKTSIGSLMGQEHTNIACNVHGGEIMKLMDNAAGITAARHSGTNIVTARVECLEFHYPIYIGDLVTFTGKLSFVGNSSMEVYVEVIVEDIRNKKAPRIAATAYFTMVALDDEGRPTSVPSLEIINEEERNLFEAGKKRYLARHKGR